jgi:cobalt transporter subunit CbtB
MRLENAFVAAAAPRAGTARRTAGLVALLLGVFLIYGVGFAQPAALHNAAHDGRHSFAFPCH